jgi:hypothetical protein
MDLEEVEVLLRLEDRLPVEVEEVEVLLRLEVLPYPNLASLRLEVVLHQESRLVVEVPHLRQPGLVDPLALEFHHLNPGL